MESEQSLWESGVFVAIVAACVVVLCLILMLMTGLMYLKIRGEKMSKVHKLQGSMQPLPEQNTVNMSSPDSLKKGPTNRINFGDDDDGNS